MAWRNGLPADVCTDAGVPVFLIGFMGTGKTTLGRALAACPFAPGGDAREYVDLDELIERGEGLSVSEIFATRGEVEFRRLESEALRRVGVRHNVIIGCGGGTPCHSGNMEWMNGRGLTVLLEASRPVLLRRLTEARSQRPLLAALTPTETEAFIEAKLREREPFYSLAQMRFPSDCLETEAEIAQSCREFLAMYNAFMAGRG